MFKKTGTQQPSQSNSFGSNETCFQTYIEQNPDSFIKLGKDELKANTTAQLSKSLNSIRANSVDRISNNGLPVNSTNRILTDIKFEDQLNKLNQLNQLACSNTNANINQKRFSSSLDDVGLNNSNNLIKGLSYRLSLKDCFRNHSLVSINCSDNSASSLSRKSSDSRKGVRTSSLIGGHKYRINSSSFNENAYVSADNLKRRSSSIKLKPGSSGKYQLRKS